jgi:hypothetical protein
MTATAQDFTIYKGDTLVITVTVTNSAGAAKDLTSASIEWSAGHSPDRPANITKTTAEGGGVSITNAAGGIFTITLTATDTAAMDDVYFHRAQVTDSGSNVSTVLTGWITVKENLS